MSESTTNRADIKVAGIISSLFGAGLSFVGITKSLAVIRDMIIAIGKNNILPYSLIASSSGDIIWAALVLILGTWLLIYGAVTFAILPQK